MKFLKGVLGIIAYFGVINGVLYIFSEFEVWAWPILFGIAFGCGLIAVVISILIQIIEAKKREITPCCHGVRGALHFPERCMACSDKLEQEKAESERENAKRQAELQAKKDRELAAKQERYKEFVKRLRLPEYLKSMDPREFELIVIDLYRRMGYKATPTSYIADNGIDGILETEGKKIVLQCKRVKGYVGEPVLRDLYGAMHDASAEGAVVVTTGRVSDNAKAWAKGKPIEIIEMQELRSLIDQHFKEDEVVPDSYSVDMNTIVMCPKCGSSLRTVKTQYGTFLGCSGYPKCRYTERTLKKGGSG